MKPDSTPNTQSVCKHCQKEIKNIAGTWYEASLMKKAIDAVDAILAGACSVDGKLCRHEPVSEPASTGEPPPTEKAVDTSEPYIPLDARAKPLDTGSSLADLPEPSAPQTSAEPLLDKLRAIVFDQGRDVEYGTPEYFLLQRLRTAFIAAPQSVSGDAPTWIMKPCPKEFSAIMSSPADWLITRVDGNSRHTLYFSNDELEKLCQGYLQVIPLERLKELRAADPAPSPTPSVSTEPGAFRADFSLSPVETHAMLAMEDKNMIATIIANEFSKRLRQQLTAEQMEEVIRLNAAEQDKVGICHTHDFCDGNEIMLHALEALGIERISDALWNEAWSIAKGAGFTPAPSVAGTQPTPDKMQQEMAGLRFRIHNLERHNQYFFRCESAWCHPADKQFQNPALETFKEALAISAGAAQGTPQVEEIAREIREQIQDDLDASGGRPVILKTSTADIAKLLRKHGVGAPAQPGPQETK